MMTAPPQSSSSMHSSTDLHLEPGPHHNGGATNGSAPAGVAAPEQPPTTAEAAPTEHATASSPPAAPEAEAAPPAHEAPPTPPAPPVAAAAPPAHEAPASPPAAPVAEPAPPAPVAPARAPAPSNGRSEHAEATPPHAGAMPPISLYMAPPPMAALPPVGFDDATSPVAVRMTPPPDGTEGPGDSATGGRQTPPPRPRVAIPLAPLRELRAELHDLLSFFQRVVEDKSLTSPAFVRSAKKHIKSLLDEIEGVADEQRRSAAEAPEPSRREQAARQQQQAFNERYSDAVRHLRNLWEQMEVHPLLNAAPDTVIQQTQIDSFADLVYSAEFQIGVLTIPERMQGWIYAARPGYAIPFDLVFEDELISPANRVRLLQHLTISPRSLKGGLVDWENGLIYRYDERWWMQLLTIAVLGLVFLCCTALVIGAGILRANAWSIAPLMQLLTPGATASALPWPAIWGEVGTLLAAWTALLAGMFIHVGIGRIKQSQQPHRMPPILAICDLPLVLNAKSGRIATLLLVALVALLGLAYSTPLGAVVTLVSAFAVGYSVHSMFGAFGVSSAEAATSLEQFKQLGAAAGVVKT